MRVRQIALLARDLSEIDRCRAEMQVQVAVETTVHDSKQVLARLDAEVRPGLAVHDLDVAFLRDQHVRVGVEALILYHERNVVVARGHHAGRHVVRRYAMDDISPHQSHCDILLSDAECMVVEEKRRRRLAIGVEKLCGARRGRAIQIPCAPCLLAVIRSVRLKPRRDVRRQVPGFWNPVASRVHTQSAVQVRNHGNWSHVRPAAPDTIGLLTAVIANPGGIGPVNILLHARAGGIRHKVSSPVVIGELIEPVDFDGPVLQRRYGSGRKVEATPGVDTGFTANGRCSSYVRAIAEDSGLLERVSVGILRGKDLLLKLPCSDFVMIERRLRSRGHREARQRRGGRARPSTQTGQRVDKLRDERRAQGSRQRREWQRAKD